jgi:hypothetical protein
MEESPTRSTPRLIVSLSGDYSSCIDGSDQTLGGGGYLPVFDEGIDSLPALARR